MISKEEALSRYGYTECAEEVCIAIEDIYDSIGSCVKCKYLGEHKQTLGMGIKRYECNIHTMLRVKEDFYCANFERKQS